MRQSVLILCALFMLSPSLAISQDQGPDPESNRPLIVVTGFAVESIPPDAVRIDLDVSTIQETPALAAQVNAELADAVDQAIEKLGLSDYELSRIGYSVGRHHEWIDEERVFVGYAGKVTIRVITSDLDETGLITDAGLTAGAARIANIRYTSEQVAAARRTALSHAVEAARLDAESMATAADGSLGPLLLLSTQYAERQPEVRLSNATSVISRTELTPQDINVSARLISRWVFVPRLESDSN